MEQTRFPPPVWPVALEPDNGTTCIRQLIRRARQQRQVAREIEQLVLFEWRPPQPPRGLPLDEQRAWWYRRLADLGFEDLESPDGTFLRAGSSASHLFDRDDGLRRAPQPDGAIDVANRRGATTSRHVARAAETERWHYYLRRSLHTDWLRNDRERIIVESTIEGLSAQAIATELHTAKRKVLAVIHRVVALGLEEDRAAFDEASGVEESEACQ